MGTRALTPAGSFRLQLLKLQGQQLSLEGLLKSFVGLSRSEAAAKLRDLHALPPRFLYKFHGVAHPSVKDYLLKSQLFLSDPDSFNDPFDMQADVVFSGPPKGRAAHGFKVARERGMKFRKALDLRDRVMRKPPDLQAAFDQLRREFGVSCFITSRIGEAHPARNPLMWAHYGDKHQGLCFQFHAPSAAEVLAMALEVHYVDEYLTIDWIDRERAQYEIVEALRRKSKEWIYENERRIILRDRPKTHLPFAPGGLSGVILGMRAEANVAAVVDLMRQRRGLGLPRVRVFRAVRRKGEYRLEVRRATDIENAIKA